MSRSRQLLSRVLARFISAVGGGKHFKAKNQLLSPPPLPTLITPNQHEIQVFFFFFFSVIKFFFCNKNIIEKNLKNKLRFFCCCFVFEIEFNDLIWAYIFIFNNLFEFKFKDAKKNFKYNLNSFFLIYWIYFFLNI